MREAPYVPPMVPLARPSNMFSRTARPAKGKPEAMPLANIMMSGSTASPLTCWWPHHLPVLPTPACTCGHMHTPQHHQIWRAANGFSDAHHLNSRIPLCSIECALAIGIFDLVPRVPDAVHFLLLFMTTMT
jgi:hypothetical protein